MPPELHEQGRDRRLPEWSPDQPESVGAPTEYADAAEVPEVVARLAQITAGLGLAVPVMVAIVLALGSCVLCGLVMMAAGWRLF